MQSIIGQNTKQIIHRQGVKQKVIAEKAGYPEKMFSNMLNGRKLITEVDILPICFALEVTPNELFGVTGTEE